MSGATLLTVTGSGFIPQSTLTVNGSAFPATVVSSTELTATMSALMVAQPAAFNLVVSNPAPGGGASEAATFTVLAQGSVTPTGNPQVALYSFSSPRDATVSIEFGTDTTYGKQHLGAEHASGWRGSPDSCGGNDGQYHLSHAGGCELPRWHPVR